MTARALTGHRVWDGGRDDEGHRNYSVVHIVESAVSDGPYCVMHAAGLPEIGAEWHFFDDVDPWAFCTPERKVALHHPKEGEKARYWSVTDTFSTKPRKRCQDTQIDNPLLEPMRLSGSFVKGTIEAKKDHLGETIVSSSHELIKGSAVEFDDSRPTVKISQNVLYLELGLLASFMNRLNDAPLWGLPKRCIKMSGLSWERKLYGRCSFYYSRDFEFDIDFNTFDRFVPDEGTKCLHGHWRYKTKKDDPHPDADDQADENAWILDRVNGRVPNRQNPSHFSRFKDRNGELSRTLLNGFGLPANVFVHDPFGSGGTGTITGTGTGTGTGDIRRTEAADILVKYYQEANLLLLGLPTSL